jgi:hypothetical protein
MNNPLNHKQMLNLKLRNPNQKTRSENLALRERRGSAKSVLLIENSSEHAIAAKSGLKASIITVSDVVTTIFAKCAPGKASTA